jgi:hypothetical protein
VLQKPFTGHGLERVGVGNDGLPFCLFLEFTRVDALIENSPRFDLPLTRCRSRARDSVTSGQMPNASRRSVPLNRYFSHHSLEPLGSTCRYRPLESLSL